MNTQSLIGDFFAPLLSCEGMGFDEILEELRERTILDSQSRYFDWTASGLAYESIESRIQKILPFYANTHSFSSTHARAMGALYEEARFALAQALGLDEDFVLIGCGSGASGAIKKFQELTGIYLPPATRTRLELDSHALDMPKVFISSYEHHSNEISLREGLCEVEKIALDSQGRFCLKDFSQKLQNSKHREVIASIALASNVSGIISPFADIATIFKTHASEGILAFDAASSSPYMNIPSRYFDALFLAPHKLLGGVQSCGVLAVRKSLCKNPIPSFSGGGTIKYASDNGQLYVENLAHKEEAGTPYIIGFLRAALAYKLRNEIGLEHIGRRERVLSRIFLKELRSIPALTLYGDWSGVEENLGIFSFNIACVSPFELSMLLSQKFGIQTRAGCSCAGPYGHYLMELDSLAFDDAQSKAALCDLLQNPHKRPGWLRISLHYTHSIEDIEYLIESLHKCVKILRT
ncbi:aminotransferase class V-fold PLP-dependent enzyme [uncultured Helicobacter sp.]|uniref:aminotransferase class V-fold PLP-dependent enzyme n=1 Tax=uncultured Helicobacter sp. TaxID=175537 RepID=UPI00374F918A